MKKQLLCGVLSATLAVSCLSMGVYAEETAEPEASAPSQYAQETVQGSAVLHCFNWSYNTIRENLADIAAAGYTAVQTSPVQPPKNYNAAWTSVMDSSGGQWWKLYQPIDICVADGNTWLGTKAELAELCEEAETQYGIKVIVDIVANHLANIQSGGGFDNLSPEVPAALRHAEYFHDELKDTSYRDSSHSARYYSTHGQMGMPDLNTANSYIQGRMLGLLEECVDIGVDGFRRTTPMTRKATSGRTSSAASTPTAREMTFPRSSATARYWEIPAPRTSPPTTRRIWRSPTAAAAARRVRLCRTATPRVSRAPDTTLV